MSAGNFKSCVTRPPAPPAISQVCRKLRYETLPIFYGANSFRIYLAQARERSEMEILSNKVREWMDAVAEKLPHMTKLIVENYRGRGEGDETLRYHHPSLKKGVYEEVAKMSDF